MIVRRRPSLGTRLARLILAINPVANASPAHP